METRIRKSLEIPARKRQGSPTEMETNAEKTFLLVINLWVFRFEYTKEQRKSWIIFRENLNLEDPCNRVFFFVHASPIRRFDLPFKGNTYNTITIVRDQQCFAFSIRSHSVYI